MLKCIDRGVEEQALLRLNEEYVMEEEEEPCDLPGMPIYSKDTVTQGDLTVMSLSLRLEDPVRAESF